MTKDKQNETEETNTLMCAILTVFILVSSLYLSFEIGLNHTHRMEHALIVFMCVGLGQLIIVLCMRVIFGIDEFKFRLGDNIIKD